MPHVFVGTPALWIGFLIFIVAMLALDLGVLHRRAHAISLKEAGIWSAVWVSLAMTFNVVLYFAFGPQRALEFTTGYVIEKALSVDNIFVFVVIFSAFSVPPRLQHRVLFWGVFGALLMRAVFIVLGGAFLDAFHWAIYVFGAILLVTGARLMISKGGVDIHPEKNPIVRLFRRYVPVTARYVDGKFFVKEKGRRHATPLLLTLLAVEGTDVVFAVDSIPAIFAITTDPFIVFTSNIFAILGLRSLYFLLAGIIDKFRYLKFGLSLVLIFVGAKMVLVQFVKVPILVSLAVIACLLAASIIASVLRDSMDHRRSRRAAD